MKKLIITLLALSGTLMTGTSFAQTYVDPSQYTTGTPLNLQAPNIKGSYNNAVPNGNIFGFCSGPRPGRHDPLRAVYDSICPAGKVSQPQP
jgi:hypothetical protein